MSEPTLSDLLGGAAAPFPIDHAGKTWKVGPPTKLARDAYHKFVVAALVQGAQQADADVPGIGAMAQLRDQITDGKHKPGGPLWVRTTEGPRGNACFLAALLYPNHPDVSLADADALVAAAPDAVGIALKVMVPDFLEVLAADERMPRPVAVALAAMAPAIRAKLSDYQTPGGSTATNSP